MATKSAERQPATATCSCCESTHEVVRDVQMEPLSPEQSQQREDIITALRESKPTSALEGYFSVLKRGAPDRNVNTFEQGLRLFADIVGPKRSHFYLNSLTGLHFESTFASAWQTAHADIPITVWDLDFTRQCPPSWKNTIRDGRHVLILDADVSISRALDELIIGPTTIDCGMFCQLAHWMAIRYILGNAIFDKAFKCQPGEFVITQVWETAMNTERSEGNLLHRYYNPCGAISARELHPIITRTIHNHERYLEKHPGGSGRLQNVLQVGDRYIVFRPGCQRGTLTADDVNEAMVINFNACRDFMDAKKLALWSLIPNYVHPDHAPNDCRTMMLQAQSTEYLSISLDDLLQNRRLDGPKLCFDVMRLLNDIFSPA